MEGRPAERYHMENDGMGGKALWFALIQDPLLISRNPRS